MFQFEWPWLLMGLPLPLLVYWLTPPAKRQEAALKVPYFATVAALAGHGKPTSNPDWARTALAALLWVLLILAAARPQWVGEPVALPASGRDLLLAVDLSGSMEIADMVVDGEQIPRILVIKQVVGEFVKQRESDRLGLILFGTQAYLQAPLTFDRTTVKTLLQEAQLGFAGEKTAIGDAIGLAVKRLKDRPESNRVVILLTDGANTAGEIDPRRAADLAKIAGIKIYTVGVGADEMLQRSFFGGVRRVNPSVDLDEDTLRYIAEQTGGEYFRARDPQQLAEIYAELDRLEPIEQEEQMFRPTKALFFWPLGTALLLSFALAASMAMGGRSTLHTGT